SRAVWQEWRRRVNARLVSRPDDATQASTGPQALARRLAIGQAVGLELSREGLVDAKHLWGTITGSAVGPQGDVCGVTTTSGLAWKVAGRIGDSPILGAGLYVHQDAGAAGSTGRGEANLYHLSSFSIVSALRRGASPKDAAMTALRE